MDLYEEITWDIVLVEQNLVDLNQVMGRVCALKA